ncbi:MAG: hypothetical protein K6G38_03610 [Gammaproteobacteria bacterium]|nr:hypothetical protein [Gammaproteobacteria bacterium]
MAKEGNSNSANRTKTQSVIIALALLAIGILFCVSLNKTVEVISWIVGISIIISGLGMLVPSLVNFKRVVSILSLAGALVIGFGVFFIIYKLAGLLVTFIPILLISIGSVFVLDVLLLLLAHKSRNVGLIVIELVFGLVCITLGILLLTVDSFKQYAALVFGIALCIYAVYSLVNILFLKK